MSEDVSFSPTIANLPELEEGLLDESTAKSQYHLKIKVGLTEFEARGPVEVVREDYADFRQFLHEVGGKLIEQKTAADPQTEAIESNTDEFAWDRLYIREDDRISLNILPEGKNANADALLLLIYGFQQLQGLEAVSSVALMEAAKQSGLRIDRIDRSFTPEHNKYILKGGSGKGSRYSLNNRGKNVAQQLLEEMFE